ncbi:transposase [Cohnella lupini]|uniref:Transposase-like zinc ribbon protein n=1 Tax=Cohnella lupini TaxID=1294267 RepID=A0A3D9IVG0_9BACL|nr:transposase [Cohnella lupini]RED65790.1 transposase-like zinc ribbon protein [Cohnella lupini]
MEKTISFEEFCSRYDNEESCIQALFHSRWPDGFHCPRCSHRHFYLIRSRKLPLYECRDCRAQTSLIAGTIMEGSRTSLRLWFQAIFLHAMPHGISATRLSSTINVTYKTSWLICHKIRQAMIHSNSQKLLSGIVRINWGIYGRPYNPTIFRHPQEQPLLVGVSMDNDQQITHLKIQKIPDNQLIYDRITPHAGHLFIRQHVDPSVTDLSIVIQKFSRHRIRPLIQLSQRASSWINKTFTGIGPKHLQSYLDQFCYGFNATIKQGNLFENLLNHCSTTPVLQYPVLIRREDNSAHLKRDYFDSLLKTG